LFVVHCTIAIKDIFFTYRRQSFLPMFPKQQVMNGQICHREYHHPVMLTSCQGKTCLRRCFSSSISLDNEEFPRRRAGRFHAAVSLSDFTPRFHAAFSRRCFKPLVRIHWFMTFCDVSNMFYSKISLVCSCTANLDVANIDWLSLPSGCSSYVGL